MWQTLRKRSPQEKSANVIGITLFVLFVVLFAVGTFIFKVDDFNTPSLATLRDEVITNYTKILYTQQKNISVYDLLVSIDTTMWERSQPIMVDPRIDPIPVLNMMLGIKEEFASSNPLLTSIYFLVANLVISFIIICLCYVLDRKFNERFGTVGYCSSAIGWKDTVVAAKDWTGFSCPPRDILLEYQKKHEQKNDEENDQIRVCCMDNPPPKCPERTAFLHPVRYPRPAIKLLVLYMIFSTILATLLAIFKRTNFSDEFFKVLNFCAGIAPFTSEETVWDYIAWIISLFGVILYNYTVYGLSMIIIDIIFTTMGVHERITPILID